MPPDAGPGPAAGALLAVEGLNVSYGASKVLFDVALTVAPREVVACVGRNGAGKSTLLKTISGFLRPDAGSIRCGDTRLLGLRSYEIARLGIKYVPQDKKVFSDLTVRENLELGSYASGDYDWGRITGYFPKLARLMDRKGGYLSGGERQMLMIGRALLGNPKLLLVDEPAEGLAPSIVSHLREVLRELSAATALVLVEQNLPLVCAIANRVYALKEGRIVAELSEPGSISPGACERYL
ncbi:MAG: ABC transporter ATP-binding protein [Burkholderiales bacterium]|nr:ABC transporter ATP-binding protein [Burkholderiales bacterium]